MAVVAQAATLRSRVPFIHFFDGFRTSHELNTIESLTDDDLRALVSEELVHAHRGRALSPDRPFIRGTAQNPDTYFQSRETVNPYYARTPEIVQEAMDELAARVGRSYQLVSYHGHPEAERVLVLVGSGAVTARRDGRAPGLGGRAGRRRRDPARAPVPGGADPRRPAAHRPPGRGPRPHEGAGIGGRAALPRRGRGARRGAYAAACASCRSSSAGATGSRRRSSPRRWSPACSASSEATGPAAASPSASTTTSAARASPWARRSTSSRRAPSAPSSSASAPTAPSARTRTRSRSWATPASAPRATSSTTRRSRARRPSRTCASAKSRSRPRIS